MNSILKLTVVLITAFSITACNNDASNKSGPDSTQTADSHEHSYRCPMNCEKKEKLIKNQANVRFVEWSWNISMGKTMG